VRFSAAVDWRSAGHSADQVDALVWTLTDLLLEPMHNARIFEYYRQSAENAGS